MARRFCADTPRAMIAVLAICATAMVPSAYSQLLVIALGATLGVVLSRSNSISKRQSVTNSDFQAFHVSRRVGLTAWCVFVGSLVVLPPLTEFDGTHAIAEFSAFYHSGALVFGGGHVILPLLQQQTVAAPIPRERFSPSTPFGHPQFVVDGLEFPQ
ncbi:protein of unknown function (plasmid) [Pararobbsia alpina]